MTRATPSNAVVATPWRAASVAAAAFASLLAACNSSDSGPPIPIDDLPRLLADAHCNNLGPCCMTAGFPFDPIQCHATAESDVRGLIAQNRSANVVYDANAARGCVNTYTAVAQACSDPNELGNACRYIFAGTLQLGQPCASTSECVPGASCQRPGDGGVSQCSGSTPPVHALLGDSCNATCTIASSGNITSCSVAGGGQGGGVGSCYTNDGVYCDSTRTCALSPALSQPCTANTPCAGDAFCDNGLCAAKRTSGSCGQLNDGCAASAYCATATRQCQPRKATGAACATTSECSSMDRCSGGTCRARTIASASACMGNL